MIADACPYCGAAKRYPSCAGMEYGCGSWAAENGAKVQSTECARYIRLRISQLRRMADLIDEKTREWGRILDGVPKEYRMEGSWRRRWMRRMRALRTACLAEIERLRGEG